MTIAVGAKYPWGSLNKLPPPDSNIPEAVIIASDSRFSKMQGTALTPIIDVGTKVFQLGIDATAVYAGTSRIGEACIDELRWKLSKQHISKSDHSKKIAQKVFQDVYKHSLSEMKLTKYDAPLYIMIGACNKQGKAELYSASYDTNFSLEPVTGLNAVALPTTKDFFYYLLNNELNKQIEDELSRRSRYPKIPWASWVPMPIPAIHVAILITATLNIIIQTNADRSIGGLVQCALMTKEGVSFPGISYTADPSNKGPGWTRATAKQDELKTVTGTSSLFSFYHLSD